MAAGSGDQVVPLPEESYQAYRKSLGLQDESRQTMLRDLIKAYENSRRHEDAIARHAQFEDAPTLNH